MTRKVFKNILIIRTDRIGDVVLTTPAIKAVRNYFPEAKITVLMSPVTLDLLQGVDFIDEFMLDDRQGVNKGNKGFLKLVQQVRSKKFDLVINYHTKKRSNLCSYLAGVPYRLGYKNDKYGFLLNHPVEDNRHLGEVHEAQYCLDLLREIGIESDNLDLEIMVRQDSEQWIDNFLELNSIQAGSPMVVIHPAASDPAKQWPKECFVELINRIAQRSDNIQFLVIGTEENRNLSEFIVNECRAKALEMAGLLSLSQLVSLLKRVDIMVSNDSGPVHVAAAVKTPVVSIFTRNQPGINPQRWQPLGEKSRIVTVGFDDEISFKKAQEYDPQSMEAIPVNAVLEAVDALSKLC